MAAKSKMTPARVKKICDAIQSGMPSGKAAAAAGVGRRTFYRWLDDEEFKRKVEAAQAEFIEDNLHVIRNAARTGGNGRLFGEKGGCWQASAWLLERNFPTDFGRRVEVGGGDGDRAAEERARDIMGAIKEARDGESESDVAPSAAEGGDAENNSGEKNGENDAQSG